VGDRSYLAIATYMLYYLFMKYKPLKLRNISNDIQRELKNPEFAKIYNEELIRLELAHRLAKTREKAHLSQTMVAKRMGVSPQLVSRIEAGNLNLTIGTIFRYAKSVGSELSFSLKPVKAH